MIGQRSIDPAALQKAVNVILRAAGDLAQGAEKAKAASHAGGLPGYSVSAASAAADVRHSAASLLAMASALSVRRSLFLSAVNDPLLAMRIDSAELNDPDKFWNDIVGLAIETARDNAVEPSIKGIAALNAKVLTKLAAIVGPVDSLTLNRMRIALAKGSEAFWKQFAVSPAFGRFEIGRAELSKAAQSALLRAAATNRGAAELLETLTKAGKGAGTSALAGLLSGAFQFLQDEHDGIRDHRLQRVAVSGGAGAISAGIGFAICALGGLETGGLACLGVVAVAGVGGSVAASDINDNLMSDRDKWAQMSPAERKYAKAVLDARKLEQWYIRYGKPTGSDLELQLASARREVQGIPRSDRRIVRYFRADGSLLCTQQMRGDTVTQTKYFDTTGKEVDT